MPAEATHPPSGRCCGYQTRTFALLLIHMASPCSSCAFSTPLSNGRVVLGAVEPPYLECSSAVFQQACPDQFLLFGSETVSSFTQSVRPIRSTRRLHPRLRHQLAGFTGDEVKVVCHFERQAVIVVLTQLLVTGCSAGRTVVQVANTQVFTAQRNPSGRYPKPKLSAPRIAALMMSRPVSGRRPPAEAGS